MHQHVPKVLILNIIDVNNTGGILNKIVIWHKLGTCLLRD